MVSSPPSPGRSAARRRTRSKGACSSVARWSSGRATTKAHIARAALEAIAYQNRDVLDAMAQDSRAPLQALRVDGGAAANNFLCQFQADVLHVEVLRPAVTETTAMGAAFLAGVGAGLWKTADLAGRWR